MGLSILGAAQVASSWATRKAAPRHISNPNYALYVDYYGDVYARYIGPFDGYIEYAIWVPKTLVANQKAPLQNGYLNQRFDCV